MKEPVVEDLTFLRTHYKRLFSQKGDNSEGMQWSDETTHHRRFALLTEPMQLAEASLLDFGCGSGHLYQYLQSSGRLPREYTGYDIVDDMIAAAQAKFPAGHFEERDILETSPGRTFDYVLSCGPFYNRTRNNWEVMTQCLRALYAVTNTLMAVSLISNYVEFSNPELNYLSPERVFAFCKTELSPLVTLRHDFCLKPGIIPYEFIIYVHKSDIPPVTALA